MINNFWFYFFLTPVVVGTIILSIPSFYYSSMNHPVFEDAVSTCKDISNEDVYATQYGTLQDKCIANYMGEPKVLEPLVFLFYIIIFISAIPLIFYYLFRLIRDKK